LGKSVRIYILPPALIIHLPHQFLKLDQQASTVRYGDAANLAADALKVLQLLEPAEGFVLIQQLCRVYFI